MDKLKIGLNIVNFFLAMRTRLASIVATPVNTSLQNINKRNLIHIYLNETYRQVISYYKNLS